MPIYEYQCASCGAVNERLVRSDTNLATIECEVCGHEAKRIQSTFRIDGAAPRTSDASLAATGRDFASNPDKFVKAMDTFGEKVGNPLTASEKERAVERLKKT